MTNLVFTVDVEDWHHSNLSDFSPPQGTKSILPETMPLLLDLLEQSEIRATFFILAKVLPDLKSFIPRLRDSGHEIASHGSGHALAYDQSEDEFRQDVSSAMARLQDTFGTKIRGYRAPSWSIVPGNRRYLRILQEEGYCYDASLMPFKTHIFGYPGAPRRPFLPIIEGQTLSLFELPGTTTLVAGRPIAFTGGFFLRTLPLALIRRFTKKTLEENIPVVFYIHPRELIVKQPLPPLGLKDRFIHLHGLATVRKKLGAIWEMGGFKTMGELVDQMQNTKQDAISI